MSEIINDIFTPMNHREIEYNAKKLLGCNIPITFSSYQKSDMYLVEDESKPSIAKLLDWLDTTGSRLFDDDLVMDYGTDCLRLYLLFEKTPKENDPYYDSWQECALEGIYKFLGRYRRMVLTAYVWNMQGKYADMVSKNDIENMQKTLVAARDKILVCANRANDMPNRHNIVAALMEAQKYMQKALKTGEIVNQIHKQHIEMAVPHSEHLGNNMMVNSTLNSNSNISEEVKSILIAFIVLMEPYAPYISKELLTIVQK